MARVTGPLFSLHAAGSVAQLLTYRTIRRRHVAQRHAAPTGPASETQLGERQRMRDASAAWATLSDNDRSIWNNFNRPVRRSGWMDFFRQWIHQNCTPGQHPQIPATHPGNRDSNPPPADPPPTTLGALLVHGTRRWPHTN